MQSNAALKQDINVENVPIGNSQRYITITGTWLAWLFDALDATIFSFVMLAVSKSFSVQLSEVISTVAWFLLATGLGGLLLGNISDKIGRKKTIVLSVLAYAISTVLCGFAHSVFELNIYRFVVGLAVGGLWSAAASLISEIWEPKGRAKAIAVMQTGWAGGNLLAAIFAWNLLNPHDPESWRNLFIYASIPAFLVVLFVFFFVKESPVWLANKEKFKRKENQVNILTIFQPEFLKTTVLALIVSILSMFGYWIITTFTPTYLTKILKVRIDEAPVFLVWSGVGAMIGYLVYGWMAEKLGRRLSFAIFFLGLTIFIPIYTFTASHMPLTNGKLEFTTANVMTLGVMSALVGFCTGYFSGFGAWYSELFPTRVRSTAAGFCFNFGRVGAIAGIKLVPILIPLIGFSLTICISSLTYLLSAIMVFTLRETKGTQITSD